jgi:hypothetical protein
MQGKIMRDTLREAAGDERVGLSVSLPRHLVLLLSAKAAEIDASLSGLLKLVLDKYYEKEKTVDSRAVAKGILSMRVLEKDLINLTQKLDLQPEDFPSVPHSDFTLHPEHKEKRREEFNKANDDRIAMLERQLSHVQTELKSIKSP